MTERAYQALALSLANRLTRRGFIWTALVACGDQEIRRSHIPLA
jgi:hypothetical protein